MSNATNHNYDAEMAAVSSAARPCVNAADMSASRTDSSCGEPASTAQSIRHIYVHIPFCARICPYCAFYKDLLDRSQTWRFCEAILRELELHQSPRRTGDRRSLSRPSTIYFG